MVQTLQSQITARRAAKTAAQPAAASAQQAAEKAAQEADDQAWRDKYLAELQSVWSAEDRAESKLDIAALSEGEALKLLKNVLSLRGSLTEEQLKTNLFFLVKELLRHDPKYIVVAATAGMTDAQREFLENKSLTSSALALINGTMKLKDLSYNLQPTPAAPKATTTPAAPPVPPAPPAPPVPPAKNADMVPAGELAAELSITVVDVLALADLVCGDSKTLVSRSKVTAAKDAAKAAAEVPKPPAQPKQDPPKPKPVDTTEPKPVPAPPKPIEIVDFSDEFTDHFVASVQACLDELEAIELV